MARLVALRPGEPIGVVALSGPVDPARLRVGLARLQTWGHPLLLAPNLDAREGYLAGGDEERLEGLDWVLERGARVILAARGGYGVTRLLSRLPWSHLQEAQACLIGFSDLTAVINPLALRSGVGQVHGPMVAAGLGRPGNERRLRRLLAGELEGRTLFRFPADAVARPGRADGPALGGNLSLMEALVGTPVEPNLGGAVLFIEEVGEPLYRLDRMLTHLASSARLSGVKALISGSLRGCGWASGSSTQWRRLLLDAVPSGVPVVTGLPFGHQAANMALPIGVPVEVDTREGRVIWRT